MKINLAYVFVFLGIFVSIASYAEYYYGVNPELQFRHGAFFVIGILMAFVGLLMKLFLAHWITDIQFFERKKKRHMFD